MDNVEELIEKVLRASAKEQHELTVKLIALKDERAIWLLIEALGDSDESRRLNAETTLFNIGEPAIDPLIRAMLTNENPIIRERATETVGGMESERVIGPLITALSDAHKPVRSRARFSLSVLKGTHKTYGKQVIEHLVDASRKPENRRIRRTISQIIDEIDGRAKKKEHNFGVRETEVIPRKTIPKEFEMMMADRTPKVRMK